MNSLRFSSGSSFFLHSSCDVLIGKVPAPPVPRRPGLLPAASFNALIAQALDAEGAIKGN
jgi:hypothetical protein